MIKKGPENANAMRVMVEICAMNVVNVISKPFPTIHTSNVHVIKHSKALKW